MPFCGAANCGANTADLKCARCQGVFYCNTACQRSDWKRHKRYCKPLPISAAGASTPPRQLQRCRVSTSQVDAALYGTVYSFTHADFASRSALKNELTSVLKAAKALLARGARPDVVFRLAGVEKLDTCSSCLMLLCANGSPGMEPLLELLLAADCKPAVDANAAGQLSAAGPCTPLYCAIAQQQHSFIRLLVAHGADVKAPCAQYEYGGVEWPVPACVDNICQALVDNRATAGALETLDALVAAGADVDAVEDRQFGDRPLDDTALCTTLCGPDLQPTKRAVLDAVAMRLIEAGANVHARHSSQRRPLDLAASLPSLDVFRALIAKGADPSPTPFIVDVAAGDINEGDRFGTHYLQEAVKHGRADVLQAAAAAGVNLKKITLLGLSRASLLASAALAGQVACVRFLLDYGLEVNEVHQVQSLNFTACDIVRARTVKPDDVDHGPEVLMILRAAGGKCYDEL